MKYSQLITILDCRSQMGLVSGFEAKIMDLRWVKLINGGVKEHQLC